MTFFTEDLARFGAYSANYQRRRTIIASDFSEGVFSFKVSDYFKDLSRHYEGAQQSSFNISVNVANRRRVCLQLSISFGWFDVMVSFHWFSSTWNSSNNISSQLCLISKKALYQSMVFRMTNKKENSEKITAESIIKNRLAAPEPHKVKMLFELEKLR